MKRIHVGGACLNQTPLDIQGNTERIIQAINTARASGVQMLCLPELCITGYGCEDAFLRDDLHQAALEGLSRILDYTKGMLVIVGLPLRYGGQSYNTAAVLTDGKLSGFTAKEKLAGDGIYYEPRWFKSWPKGVISEIQVLNTRVPIGQAVYNIGGVRLAIEICEDAWAADRPAIHYHKYGVDILFNPTASDFSLQKTHIREHLVCDASRAFSCTYVYANLLGNEAGRIIYDGEILIASQGECLMRNRRFSYQSFNVQSTIIDLDINRKIRTGKFHIPFPGNEENVIHENQITWTNADDSIPHSEVYPRECAEEEFSKAVALGLFDYLRKSRSKGFVISLSGGADSSACLVLAASAFHNAKEELGIEGLKKKLEYIQINSNTNYLFQLITCVYQSTENNGPETLESAESLSKDLGVNFIQWDIQSLLNAYTEMVEKSIHKTFGWETDDRVLQNIQARVRVPGVWMLANALDALLITTSNRSEAATGYTTMDGDSSGGISPLAGISKYFLLRWLKWAEHNLNIPALKKVNQLTPTAELRPFAKAQSDENDLMPYEILDFLEQAFVKEGQNEEVLRKRMKEKYPQADTDVYVSRFLKLFTQNQWKRERLAPSFHLDNYNLDPKTGYRFPILSNLQGMK